MHSRDSSLADYDYYARSSISSLAKGSTPTTNHAQPVRSAAVKKQISLAQIVPPSFSAFRSQTSSIPLSSPRTLNRKPAFHASPRTTSFSAAEQPSPRFAEPPSRPFSLDGPLPEQPSVLASDDSPILTDDIAAISEERTSNAFSLPAYDHAVSIDSRLAATEPVPSRRNSRLSSIPVRPNYARGPTISRTAKQSASSMDSGAYSNEQYSPAKRLSIKTSTNGHKSTPSMTLQLDGIQRTLSDESLSTSELQQARTERSLPKSPARLGSFFGWKSSPQKSGSESPTTTFSDRSPSTLPSPRLQKPLPMEYAGNSRLTPPGLDIHRANSGSQYFDNSATPLLLGTPEANAHVQELERELAQISTELAESIRRELDLEDELDRLRLELPTQEHADIGRRNSDYFSDSGASSSRVPVADPEAKIEHIERLRRKAEQEKAQQRVDTAQRLKTELNRRRDLESLVQSLEEQLQKRFDDESVRGDMDLHIEQLEATLDDTKRRLGQERQDKENFEHLYIAMQGELERYRNERDNLRDEEVQQLRARAEGLEAEAADTQALMYENTRLQQELAALREEQKRSRFSSIAEEDDVGVTSPISAGPRSGLAWSGSLVRSGSKRAGSLGRSGSVKEGGRQHSGSVSAVQSVSVEGFKEIEDQRDALHKALKLLISRYEKQQKEHGKAIKKLASAKMAAEQAASPRRNQYQREVSVLKDEVTTLRKRTEDALEQKWQYEKGLSGIKIDLDRAEQETRGLRVLLQDHDVLAPSPRGLSHQPGRSLETADSRLKLSIAGAEGERDQARRIAEEYRQRALDLQEASSSDTDDPPPAVAKLFDSANRMDELSEQLEQQAESNISLRARLAQAVRKGEREQKDSTRVIEEMQKRLAGMEDSVIEAQQHSETTLGNHEAEVRRIEEASSPSLQRLEITLPEPQKLSPTSPMLRKTPRVGSFKKMSDASLLEVSRTRTLERKVRELERLLREAEGDVKTVVQRVNKSQFEVAELTGERDAALTQMHKLQRLIVEEKERAEALITSSS